MPRMYIFSLNPDRRRKSLWALWTAVTNSNGYGLRLCFVLFLWIFCPCRAKPYVSCHLVLVCVCLCGFLESLFLFFLFCYSNCFSLMILRLLFSKGYIKRGDAWNLAGIKHLLLLCKFHVKQDVFAGNGESVKSLRILSLLSWWITIVGTL